MFKGFIETIRHINHASSFETYLMSVQRSGLPGVPTIEEAKRDYRSACRHETTFFLG